MNSLSLDMVWGLTRSFASLHARTRSSSCVVHSGVLLFLVVSPAISQHEEILFDNLSVQDGLSNGIVHVILQDYQGFVWFGTNDGLCRYDGYEMTVYKHDPNDPTSLSDNLIWSLCEDAENTLWVGTYEGGLNRFDRITERFTRFEHDPGDPSSVNHNRIRAIYEDRSGTLWIGTGGGGLDRLDRETGRFTHLVRDSTHTNLLKDNFIISILEDHTGILWVGTRTGGLHAFDQTRHTMTQYKHSPDDPRSVSDGFVVAIHEDRSGTLWVGTTTGLNRFDRKRNQFIHYTHDPADPQSLGNPAVYAIEGDMLNESYLWIGTLGGGLDRFDKATATSTHHKRQPHNPKSLNNDDVLTLYTDKSGTLWIGTYSGGVNKIHRAKKNFRLFKNDPDDTSSLAPGDVWSICEDRQGVLWVGTKGGGLSTYNAKTGGFFHYTHQPSNPRSLAGDDVSAIYEDRLGFFWIGVRGAGLDLFDREKGNFTHYSHSPTDPNTLSSNEIYGCLYEDRDGRLWIGTANGLNRFDRTSGQFKRYLRDRTNPRTLSDNRIFTICGDSSGFLWIGTEGGGLNRFDPRFEEFVHYKNDQTNPKSLSNNIVTAIFEMSVDGRLYLWVGTAGGLNRLDRDRSEFMRYSVEDGLPSDYIESIVGDNNGNLWLSTSKGVSRFTPGTNTFRNYDVHDGLQGDVFSDASFKNANGEIFLGGLNGLTMFHPDSIRDNSHVPPVVLTKFNILGRPANFDTAITQMKSIRLEYNQNFFSLEFAALDLTAPQKNRYAYMLEGLDPSWNHSQRRRFASYTNVAPGDYVLRVKGSNNDGIWNEAGVSIPITITPPYWATWWFRTSMVILFIAILTGAYQYRVSKLLEMERMRVRIASDLHDDIGSSLSSIALVTEMVRNRLPAEVQERHQLSDVSHAARHTADALKDIVWIINPEHDKVDDIVLRMKDAAARLLVGIDYSFHCNNTALAHVLDMEFRRHVLLIYKETLNNIAKYSHANKVDITIENIGPTFHLQICDNGVGFDEATIRKGNGLNNLRKRAAIIGGTIEISSSLGKGTSVRLEARIP